MRKFRESLMFLLGAAAAVVAKRAVRAREKFMVRYYFFCIVVYRSQMMNKMNWICVVPSVEEGLQCLCALFVQNALGVRGRAIT